MCLNKNELVSQTRQQVTEKRAMYVDKCKCNPQNSRKKNSPGIRTFAFPLWPNEPSITASSPKPQHSHSTSPISQGSALSHHLTSWQLHTQSSKQLHVCLFLKHWFHNNCVFILHLDRSNNQNPEWSHTRKWTVPFLLHPPSSLVYKFSASVKLFLGMPKTRRPLPKL